MDMQQINSIFNKVMAKGRSTLTEIEGYDVAAAMWREA